MQKEIAIKASQLLEAITSADICLDELDRDAFFDIPGDVLQELIKVLENHKKSLEKELCDL